MVTDKEEIMEINTKTEIKQVFAHEREGASYAATSANGEVSVAVHLSTVLDPMSVTMSVEEFPMFVEFCTQVAAGLAAAPAPAEPTKLVPITTTNTK
jgi:hypothetical protein